MATSPAAPPGHGPFAVGNRTVNHAIVGILRTRGVHHACSHYIALITLTGRRTGRRYAIPVFYRRSGDTVTIPVGWSARKLWWRNLRGLGAPVELRLAGQTRTGHAVALEETTGVRVEVELDPLP